MIDYRRRELTPSVEVYADRTGEKPRLRPPDHEARLAAHFRRIRAVLDKQARKAARRREEQQ